MAHNSIATYMRMLRTFYNWCNADSFSSLAVPAVKEKETVKDTYTDLCTSQRMSERFCMQWLPYSAQWFLVAAL